MGQKGPGSLGLQLHTLLSPDTECASAQIAEKVRSCTAFTSSRARE
jgi:hypothetical protein